MVATPRNRAASAPPGRRARALALAVLPLLAALAALAGRSEAQAPRLKNEGIVLPVPARISDDAVNQLEASVKEALKRKQPPLRTVLFDFTPDEREKEVGTSDVYACMRLMRFIRRLNLDHDKLRTVAFLRTDVCRHTVLPVLACKELVMSKTARLGNVLKDQEGGLPPEAQKAYEEVARQRPSPDVVWKMVYSDMTLLRVRVAQKGTGQKSVRLINKKTVQNSAELRKELDRLGVALVEVEKDAPAELGPGVESTYLDSARASSADYGRLCTLVRDKLEDVLAAYQLPASSTREHVLVGRTRVGAVVHLTRTVTRTKLDSLERRIKRGIGRGGNVIILYLDCEGGETADVASVAERLMQLKDDSGARDVLTIAYVPPGRSLGAATFLALGCSQIIMGKGSALGDFEYLKGTEEAASARSMLVALAKKRGLPAALFEATLQPDLGVTRVHDREGRFWLLTAAELAQEKKQAQGQGPEPEWQADEPLPIPKGQLLKIDAKLAREWGVARDAEANNLDELYRQAGVDPRGVWVSQDDWLDDVAEFFRQDLVQFFLIAFGIAGLILELKMPGAGLPGIIAAVCFVLFFWAHSFHSHFTTPAIFLFVLGLVLIGLEIFVVPGFGVTGISGIALVVVSLVLVTLEKMPSTSAEWVGVGATVTRLGLGLIAAIVGACVLAWYLPHIPYASRLVLTPPNEGENGADRDAFGGRHEEAAALLGAIGVAATTLRPAGKARFGEDYLDVIAEGDYVNPGSRVQVVEIEGNRIVVKEV
jgi:membrane-bound serine protease (ClpP class)